MSNTVEEAMKELYEVIEGVNTAIGNMETTLAPVLSPLPPNVTGDAATEHEVKLIADIELASARVRRQADAIVHMCERVAL